MPCLLKEIDKKDYLMCAGLSPDQHVSRYSDLSPDDNCTHQNYDIDSVQQPIYLIQHENLTHCKIECEADENCYMWSTKGSNPTLCTHYGIDHIFRIKLKPSSSCVTGKFSFHICTYSTESNKRRDQTTVGCSIF